MAGPVILEIETNPSTDTWAEITAAVKFDSIHMGGVAAPDGAGTGFGFDFEDLAAATTIPARRRVRLWLFANNPGDGVLLAAGRVTDKGVARRSPPVGDVRGFDVNLSDRNSELQGIEVHRWVRPAETDVARITALADAFLTGSPRTSTNLTQAFLSASNPVDLPAKTYDATNPAGVVADVCDQTRKLFYVNQWGDIFYDAPDSEANPAFLSVTDIDPDIGAWEFAPIFSGDAGTQDGTELYTGLTLAYSDSLLTVSDSDGTAEAAHDYWRETIYSDAKTTPEADAELAVILDERKIEEERFRFAIHVPEDLTGLINYGQTFSFRAAAAAVLSPVIVRASRVTWSMVRPGLWRADIEAGFPRKLAPRLTRGSAPANPPVAVVDDNNIYEVCHPTSFYLGLWTVADDPGLADLLIPTLAEGTSIVIGPATGSTTAVPGWGGGALYRVTDAAFPFGYDDAGVLSGRIVVPAQADFTGVLGIITIYLINEGVGAKTLPFEIKATEDLPNFQLEQNQSYYFKFRIGASIQQRKVWRVADSEPANYTSSVGADYGEPNIVDAGVGWTDTNDGTAPGAFTVDQLEWCYLEQYGTAYAGSQYGPVFVAVADGSTSGFTIPAYPGGGYSPGSLQAYVDGLWQPVTETNYLTGTFDLGWDPADGDTITASWRVPAA